MTRYNKIESGEPEGCVVVIDDDEGSFDVIGKPADKHVLIPTPDIAMNVGRRRRNMWQNLFEMKKRLSDTELSPELAFELKRSIGDVQEEYRMGALLALRNHSLKSGT